VTHLVVGLGNPGPEYEWTRHNVGFHVLERLALHEGALFRTARSLEGYRGPGDFVWARLHDPDAFLVKPETYMNRSGHVVAPLAEWLEVEPEGILVVYDDLDLDLGALRFRPHGGPGGHNGMRSLIQMLGTDRFPRLRLGIGRPRTDAARWVLERFDGSERVEAEISIAEASEAVLDWLRTGDLEGVMTRFHSRWNQATDRS
jgi:peptidyl-tRNA hydrolase, PTH1 family